MIKPLKKGATYDDLVGVPEHFVAEMFDGELYASPWPSPPQARATSVLAAKIGAQFDLEHYGSGGWFLLNKPELHFGNDVVVPDIAGWRRKRLPSIPNVPYMTLAPDWACEVLSPSTESLDRGQKLRVYAREGVAFVWLIDPLRRTLEVLALASGSFEQIEERSGDSRVRAQPFDALELELRGLWS